MEYAISYEFLFRKAAFKNYNLRLFQSPTNFKNQNMNLNQLKIRQSAKIDKKSFKKTIFIFNSVPTRKSDENRK